MSNEKTNIQNSGAGIRCDETSLNLYGTLTLWSDQVVCPVSQNEIPWWSERRRIEQFLTHFAADGNVFPSTQNQAKILQKTKRQCH